MNAQTSWLEKLDTPVLAIGPATVETELAVVQQRFMGLYYLHKDYLAAKPAAFLEDLLHHAEARKSSTELSVRAAAEINAAACHFILEERKGGKR